MKKMPEKIIRWGEGWWMYFFRGDRDRDKETLMFVRALVDAGQEGEGKNDMSGS